MNRFFLILVFFLSVSTYSQTEEQEGIRVGNELKAFVPEGWKAIAIAEGDLNKDGLADAVLVIEETKKENLIDNKEGLGPEVLNVNPRQFLVLLHEVNSGYKLKYLSKSLITPQNHIDSPCLGDTFVANELKIQKGVLSVSFSFWASCGSYGATNYTYKFRIQNSSFTLIGYDSYDFSRSTGDITTVSINFLTKKKCVTSGANEFYPELHEPVAKWSSIKLEKLLTLEDLQQDTEMNY